MCFGSIFKRKRVLLARLSGIQRSESYTNSSFLQSLEQELLREYQEVLYQEELLWYQKSRSQLIRDGEQNTRFYHLSTIIRKNRDKVVRLQIDGHWVEDTDVLKIQAVEFYKALFDEFYKALFDEKEVQPLTPLHRWQPMINLYEKEALLAPFSL